MAYTTSEARQELLDNVAQAANELPSARLADAYEQLDEYSGDRLEEECFRPVQMAYGRAKRPHTEFAGRHGLQAAAFEQAATGVPSQGAAVFIERAVEAAGAAEAAMRLGQAFEPETLDVSRDVSRTELTRRSHSIKRAVGLAEAQ
jgi:hypothetical protein